MSKRNESIKTTLPPYAPDVEAKRPQFERLAECLLTLTALEYSADALDVEPDENFVAAPGSEHILMNAMESHMKLLLNELLMLEPASIQRFYVEMRMHVEQMRFEQRQARKASKTDAA